MNPLIKMFAATLKTKLPDFAREAKLAAIHEGISSFSIMVPDITNPKIIVTWYAKGEKKKKEFSESEFIDFIFSLIDEAK